MSAYYNEIDPYAAQWLRNLIAAGLIAPGDVDERSIEDVTPKDVTGYVQCHFFAGIGGWSYALRLAGWPDDRPVWTGSCPCQPFSAAGKGGGFTDERHLWPAWFWLISQRRPDIIFGEQVGAAVGHGWLDLVCTDLENAGYTVGAVDLCAASVGAPHIRQRLWFVAESERGRRERADLSVRPERQEPTAPIERGAVAGLADAERGERERNRRVLECSPSERPQDVQAAVVCSSDAGSMADAAMLQPQQPEGEWAKPGETAGGESRSNIAGCRDTGNPWYPCDWLPCRDGKARPVEPGTFPLAHGLSPAMGWLRPGEDSPFRALYDQEGRPIGQTPWRIGMLRGYGNSIVPQVAAEFIAAYMEETR